MIPGRDANIFRYGLCKEQGDADWRAFRLRDDGSLDGKREDATALIPDDLVEEMHIVGDAGYVKERAAAWEETGVTTLLLSKGTVASTATGLGSSTGWCVSLKNPGGVTQTYQYSAMSGLLQNAC